MSRSKSNKDYRNEVRGEVLRTLRELLRMSQIKWRDYLAKNAKVEGFRWTDDTISRVERLGKQGSAIPVTEEMLEALYRGFEKAVADAKGQSFFVEADEMFQQLEGWQGFLHGRNNHPVGRLKEYNRARDWLLQEDGPRYIGLTGPAGVGKSHFMDALESDEDIRARYHEIIWFSIGPGADSNANPERSDFPSLLVQRIAARLNRELSLSDMQVKTPSQTQRLIETQIESARRMVGKDWWLLLVDDVWHADDLKAVNLVERGNAVRIVFTSRSSTLANNEWGLPRQKIEFGVLNNNEATRLLRARLAEFRSELGDGAIGDTEILQPLVSELEGLPLSLVIGARLLKAQLQTRGNLRESVGYLSQLLSTNKRVLIEQRPSRSTRDGLCELASVHALLDLLTVA